MTDLCLSKRKRRSLRKTISHDRQYWLLCLPGLLLLIVFSYLPMYGILLAFFDYSIRGGLFGSTFVGLQYFQEFLTGPFFWRLLGNTLALSFLGILFKFPFPIVFALALNEVRLKWFKKGVQTISYMPHFVSTVIVVGIMTNMFSPTSGIINKLLLSMGIVKNPINFFYEAAWFRPLYIGSDIWQSFGWDSIIYLAALTSVDADLYEAAELDGAGRWKKMWHVTLPGIANVVITMLILSLGSLMSVGFEKVLLMQKETTYSTSDVISTYTYREGIVGGRLGYGQAVSLFNSVVNLVLLVTFNKIAKKASEVSLW